MNNNRLLALLFSVVFTAAAIVYILTGTKHSSENPSDEFDSPLSGRVLINEVMARNSGVAPASDGGYYDWIELYNPGDAAIDISSWGLTDSPDSAAEWAFASGVSIPAKGCLLVYCSGFDQNDPRIGELHAPFRLKAGEDTAVLSDNTGGIVDAVTMVAADDGHSIGRDASDTSAWLEFSLPTPGFPNTDAGRLEYEKSIRAEDVGVVIAEFQPSNVSTFMSGSGEYPDWVELANNSDKDVDISGFGLSDDAKKPMKWVFPSDTVIPAGGRLLILCDSAEQGAYPDELHASFGLSGYKESVVLSNSAGRLIDSVDYEGIPRDASYLRTASGVWEVCQAPTPGEQ